MKCRLEENSRIHDILKVLMEGYQSGDFSQLFPYLAVDCVMRSQWVMEPNVGYAAIMDYYTGKGQSLVKSGAFPECSLVELTDSGGPIGDGSPDTGRTEVRNAVVQLLYTPGKPCLLLEQTLNGSVSRVLVDIRINDEGKVEQIDLCMPELFRYRGLFTWVDLIPATGDNENEEACIHVSDLYFSELHLFEDRAGEFFDEYACGNGISMDKWCKALSYWRAFVEAESFDEALEVVAGVDYEKGTVERPEIAKALGRCGEKLWDDRRESSAMVNGLIEWTEAYRATHDSINIYGW